MKLFRACVLLAVPLFCRAEVRLPHVISDHAVLQRERPIHLWGWASPSARLQLSFHAQTIAAEADQLGKWSAWLAPEPAGGPYVLAIAGDGAELRVSDLLVGDVWFASGQSNMEMPLAGFGNAVLKNSAKEIAAAANSRLRLLHIGTRSSDYPLDDAPDTWTTCTPETAAHFSAVAYFFGREIAARENVPVGLIDSTWGGTPADSWVSLDTLGTNPDLLPAFASRARYADKLADADSVSAEEKREDSAAKAAGKQIPSHPWHPNETSWLPAGLYNGMVAPFTPYSLKGFLWYQGETNSGPERAPYYRSLFPALIGDWRAHFNQGMLPFLYVQISSFNSPGENWGEIRDAQRRTLSVASTAMAVTTDVGDKDNVHPADKQTVGSRLALAARGLVYGEPLAYQPPLFREATTETQANGTVAMRVWFDHAERLTAKTRSVAGFELAGDDHNFAPADARIDGVTVVVTATGVTHPVYVRYAWAGYSPEGLYNAAGLPAATFTSDSSPLR